MYIPCGLKLTKLVITYIYVLGKENEHMCGICAMSDAKICRLRDFSQLLGKILHPIS